MGEDTELVSGVLMVRKRKEPEPLPTALWICAPGLLQVKGDPDSQLWDLGDALVVISDSSHRRTRTLREYEDLNDL